MASVTMPYNKDYSIDHGSLRAWVDFMCENKAPILFMTHGDSELGLLSEQEMEAVIRTVAGQARGRALVLGGTGVWWTKRTVDFINRVEDSGVDAMNVHLGRLVRNEDDIFDNLAEIDRRTELPFLISDTGYSTDLMTRIAQIPKLIGDKCHEELYQYHAFIRATKPYDFSILSAGQMKHFLFGYLIGSPAYLCPITPFAPQIGVEFFAALEKNDFVRAREMTFKYEDGLLAITGPLGYPHCYKSLLYLAGVYKTNLMRPPRKSNTLDQLGPLKEFIQKYNMI
jgi:dihydrodipicolinate synthase/N-acetylneuraminate lyase